MGRWFVRVFALTLLACGGSVASSSTGDSSGDSSGRYEQSATSPFPATGPTATADLAVACNAGDVLLSGGCDVGDGGELVENQSNGLGWECAARSSVDNVVLRVWAQCAKPSH